MRPAGPALRKARGRSHNEGVIGGLTVRCLWRARPSHWPNTHACVIGLDGRSEAFESASGSAVSDSDLQDRLGTLQTGPGAGQVALVAQRLAEVLKDAADVRVVGAEGGLEDDQGAFQLGPGAGQVALVAEYGAEIAQDAARPGMLGAKGGLLNCQGLLQLRAGAGQVAGIRRTRPR
jgi:hypothetical protein